ncbi:MAG: UbiA family prenyltransferase [Planctomycetota bacterium]
MNPTTGGALFAWLKLLRLPTVFTALSNVLCGYLLAHRPQLLDLPGQHPLWLLLASSAGLYLGGMVLNDFFDAPLDSKERPERPIPSGRISRNAAGILGFCLLGGGTLTAAANSPQSGCTALLIAACVLSYNALFKATVVGPCFMAACRLLNLLLGASTLPLSAPTAPPVILVACSLSVYILGVTWFSRSEAGTISRRGLLSGLTLVLLGLLSDAYLVSHYAAGPAMLRGSTMGLLLLALNLSMRAASAITAARPKLLQQTVGLMLISLIFRDAMLVFAVTGNAQLALLTISLLIPASLLKRIIPLS